MTTPLISVIIPCRNEKTYILNCLRSLLQQKNLQGKLEIIVVDGMSEDGTSELLKEMSNENSMIKVVTNPAKITPVALNLGIKNTSGQYISILGAHSEYSEDFFQQNLELMKDHPEVSCTGGPIISKGSNNFAKAAAISMSSTVGVGNANHRFPLYEGYAEMACFPMFKKEVFTKHGLYDESLVRNQDDEYCFRIRLNGEKIYISPKVKSSYYVRDSVSKLFKQYYLYGKWRIPVLLKHKIPIAFRQLVPALFFISIFFIFIISILIKEILIGLFLPILYVIVLIIFAISNLRKEKFSIIRHIPIAIFILHFSYAVGFFSGIISFGFKRIK